ncbi:hypothetical protein ACMA5K_05730 [Bradyrhizobium diazoefficiens]|uniref:hypothetical protein n=1 Tax=Bradyrhizobium diazoefficiens TaxID=1355477 RepID=UPI0015B63B7D|nr:hypothetical protein [Bradyrhizobium diazoefficiens]QLD40515.1 hypothetical protein HUW42_05670 [Bradyrhizobium diazoefficiens]
MAVDYVALRQKLMTDRAKLEAEIAERARRQSESDSEEVLRLLLPRSDRLLLQAGFSMADLAANDAWIEQERQRRDEAFAKRQHVPSTQDVVELPAFLPLLRTWDHPSEAERRRKGK